MERSVDTSSGCLRDLLASVHSAIGLSSGQADYVPDHHNSLDTLAKQVPDACKRNGEAFILFKKQIN
ncbi:hypothetical protein T4C_1845 [Trichinella pseudospiralis]|uniref:Uncharacterized protein n=1 Tax=Trichinella pseudospiralis TaxID=6337 RepID=A0A0V1FLI4_TRIPS|nr:hypothetical protein T4D_10921 [Trichinella pseudospiralis]KRZ35317.1 hypothetical protein T4C_1845 [Trichinella pseudospiralis]